VLHQTTESYKYSWISGCQQTWKQDFNAFEPELNDQGVVAVTRI